MQIVQGYHSFSDVTPLQPFNESRMLCTLALVVGRILPCCFCCPLLLERIFDTAYTIPLMKPTAIALTLGIVTGASKKMRPESATGSLFRAPTML